MGEVVREAGIQSLSRWGHLRQGAAVDELVDADMAAHRVQAGGFQDGDPVERLEDDGLVRPGAFGHSQLTGTRDADLDREVGFETPRRADRRGRARG
jgi:hypothetical protein